MAIGEAFYDHQKIAIDQLKSGSILCGGVGSGKSRTALAYYFIKECGGEIGLNGEDLYSPMKNPKPLYIITTARKRDTLEWEDECAPFLIQDVTIDSWNNIGKYTNVCSAFFIFDEQRVVGSGAWVKAFLQITKKNRWILLSATPGDVWTDYIPVFIANGFYKNRTEFIRRHVVFARYSKYPKIERYLEVGRLIRLKESILVNMRYSRPTKSHDETIVVSFDKEKFQTISKERWNIFEDKPIENVSELGYAMRRISNIDQSRIDKVKELIASHPKVIIFYNFDYELDILRNIGKELEIQTAEWNGHKHQPIPEKGNWIYLVQYTAGAEGWNCITTNAIIFYSQSYSYKAMVQAAGRIDRLNTPFTDLYYYHIRSNSPIDVAIERCLKRKENFNERYILDL